MTPERRALVIEEVVELVLGETMGYWDGYYLPRSEDEMKKYIAEVTQKVIEKL